MKTILYLILSALVTTSCVSTKYYNDLVTKQKAIQKERDSLAEENQKLEAGRQKLQNEYNNISKEYESLFNEKSQSYRDLKNKAGRLKALEESYNLLDKNRNSNLAISAKKNRELLAVLEAKEDSLKRESIRLSRLKSDVDSMRSKLSLQTKRVEELQQMVSEKNKTLKQLKENIRKALLNFEGKGLTITRREGKIYVSMENKLLFKSGSWEVGTEGREALEELAEVLSENPNISVLVEGHTDNVPYSGDDEIKDNWDLSTKRATSVVRILQENEDILPTNITAAGRSEYAPLSDNTSPEGKSKNRRIDIILTPKLDTVMNLLNDTE